MSFIVGRSYSISNLSYCTASTTSSYLRVGGCFYYQDETHMSVNEIRQIRVIREGEYEETYYDEHVLLCNVDGVVLFAIPCDQLNRQDNKHYISFVAENDGGDMDDWLESGGITEIYNGYDVSIYFDNPTLHGQRNFDFIYNGEKYDEDAHLFSNYIRPITLVAKEGYSLFHRDINVRFFPRTPVGWDEEESIIDISSVVVKGNQIEFGQVAFERYQTTHPEADESYNIRCEAYDLSVKKYILFGADTETIFNVSRVNGSPTEIYKEDVIYGQDYEVELSLVGKNYFTTLSSSLIKEWLYDEFFVEETHLLDCCESIDVIYVDSQKVKIIFRKVFANIDDENIFIMTEDSPYPYGKTTEELNIIHEYGLNIKFYKFVGDPMEVQKDDHLQFIIELNGTLRESCSVIAPSVTIEYFGGKPEFNYVYIEKFKRYYYINDYVCLREGIWQLSLRVDVLMSFKKDIKSQLCFVARNEYNFNPFIEDEERVAEKDDEYQIVVDSTTSEGVFIDPSSDDELTLVIGVIRGNT